MIKIGYSCDSISREDIQIWSWQNKDFSLTTEQAEECKLVVDSLLTALQTSKSGSKKIEIPAYPIFFTKQDDLFYKEKICQLLESKTNVNVEYSGMKLVMNENFKRSTIVAYKCNQFWQTNPNSDLLRKKVVQEDIKNDWIAEFNKQPSKYVVNFPSALIEAEKKNNADLFNTYHSIYDFYEREIEDFDFSKQFNTFHLDDLRILNAQVKRIDFTSSLIDQIQTTLLKRRKRWTQQLMKKLLKPSFVFTVDNLLFLREVIESDQIQIKHLDSKTASEYLEIINQRIANCLSK